jgi:hypothetical protein
MDALVDLIRSGELTRLYVSARHMTISERVKAKPKCPSCEGTKVVPQFGGFMAQTSKKS